MAEKEDDDEGVLAALLVGVGAFMRKRFLDVVKQITDSRTLDELEQLLFARRFDEALVTAELAAANLANGYSTGLVRSGNRLMENLSRSLSVLVTFDQTNTGAVDAMRRNSLRLIREFTEEQRVATRIAMVDGIARGLNPRQQALLFRQSIGLTRQQMQAVLNYRRLLEAGDAAALQRALRDRRFDSTVTAASQAGRPLTESQVDRMVQRYRDRFLAHRAEVIGRTEALSAVHEGADLAYRQAIDLGLLQADELTRTWRTAADERVRGSHVAMGGQQRAIGEPFVSGAGNLLRYPGDLNAPGSETIQCRCVLVTRYTVDSGPQEEDDDLPTT